ncbi:MAG: sterol desaturase family protein [Caulobacteraceae bacterium]|nr:sterol desaturase family protein [Caulobacteraceae bacterium]
MVVGVWIYGGTVALLVAELAAGRARALFSRRELAMYGACIALNRFVTASASAVLIAYALRLAVPFHRGAFAHAPLWLAFPVTLLTAEFCFYWVHRWSHDGAAKPWLNWLWRLHHTHHSADYMSVLVTLRQNIFWNFVVPTPWVLALAVYAGQEAAATLTIMTIYGWNLITHSDFRWDDKLRALPVVGRLFWASEHILVSPGVHHTHHGYGRDGAMYRNYAVTFAFLDWMFGTLHVPQGRPSRYGIPGPRLGVAEDVLYPLVRSRKTQPLTAPIAN